MCVAVNDERLGYQISSIRDANRSTLIQHCLYCGSIIVYTIAVKLHFFVHFVSFQTGMLKHNMPSSPMIVPIILFLSKRSLKIITDTSTVSSIAPPLAIG